MGLRAEVEGGALGWIGKGTGLFEAGHSMRKVGMREYGMCIAAVTTRAAALM